MLSSVGGIMFNLRSSALAALAAAVLVFSGAAQVPVAGAPMLDPVVVACKQDAIRPATFERNGVPLSNAPVASGDYFSFPNRTAAERGAIMNRVVNTINSTWGTRYSPELQDQPVGCTYPDGTVDPDGKYTARWVKAQGSIKMATWSFNHGGVKNALINAEKRGVRVQIIAAYSVNKYGVKGVGMNLNWRDVRNYLRTYGKDTGSYAYECSGACRGAGGTSHSKYFLFNDAGSSHLSDIVVQSSMNLTPFAVAGQWNQATVMRNADVYDDFSLIFAQSALRTGKGYYARQRGYVTNIFFPKGGAPDPVLAALSRVRCAGGTRIRAINYAVHGTRGNAIAKKLRGLWNAGCNVRFIYSVSSRPVLGILRARSGRGPVPVKQSVIKNRRGEIVKYNHSKWLAIAGNHAGSGPAWMVHSGSANWSNIAYTSDEQMQNVGSSTRAGRYFSAFDKTWNQSSSKTPRLGRVYVAGRLLPGTPEQPTYGSGMYRYLTPYGG